MISKASSFLRRLLNSSPIRQLEQKQRSEASLAVQRLGGRFAAQYPVQVVVKGLLEDRVGRVVDDDEADALYGGGEVERALNDREHGGRERTVALHEVEDPVARLAEENEQRHPENHVDSVALHLLFFRQQALLGALALEFAVRGVRGRFGRDGDRRG